MLEQSWDPTSGNLEEEFNRPVESIMRCEDFKSNFARRLSNRYILKSPVSGSRQDMLLKLQPINNTRDIQSQVPERIETCTQLSNCNNMEQIGEPVKPPDKHLKMNADIRNTEVHALNMEVETLRWQLAQTEANRQMHIALLKQIVTFLNRVKDHFDGQKNEDLPRKHVPSRVLAKSLNFNDLPRSRSVLHVNKNIDLTISPVRKISARKISKSISNVNGYKNCNGLWSQSKLSLVPEHESSQKISEEMSRLITLANTVLSTNLPDLACACVNNNNDIDTKLTEDEIERPTSLNVTINFIKDESRSTIVNSSKSDNGVTNKVVEVSSINSNSDDCVSILSHQTELEDKFSALNTLEKERDSSKSAIQPSNENVSEAFDKINDYNALSNFIEDESGFSSMSSFQEIGIPVISIIPPSPCKEVDYLEEISDILEEREKWKSDAIELDKQSVKVFWV
ncbi:unnamed protein product [Parnassius apollo]|uniref:(apollo) hypothetical protein n=1 Tax=Parnassius apollo TaxID=110799 RepID=A0A8S3WZ03_PARAO|nr:unnamed protein product [Parnassius apollo]